MVTEADREAAAQLLGGATPVGLLEGRCDNLSLIQTLARHRTASTAALTAEIQRLREWMMDKRAWAEVFALAEHPKRDLQINPLYVGDPAWKFAEAAIRRSQAALSTPSEVSEPNPDEVAGTYSAFEVSEPVAEKVVVIPEWLAKDILHFCEANAAFPPRETLIPIGAINAFRGRMERAVSEPVADHIGGEGERIAVWDVREVEDCGHRGMKGYEVLLPNGTWYDVAAHNPEDAIATANLDWRAEQAKLATPPNTNGDAVREALEKIAAMTDIEADFDGFEARDIARNALSALNHGCSQHV